MSYGYCFTEEEAEQAATEWNFNCGPTALAFAARVSLSAVRGMIPGFEEKRYTSPTMMRQGIANLSREFEPRLAGMSLDTTVPGRIAVVRVQWTGPWTHLGSNPRWAYRQTHWIATWREVNTSVAVFDVNGGIRWLDSWRKEIVPLLTVLHKRADGGWFPTHVWELQ